MVEEPRQIDLIDLSTLRPTNSECPANRLCDPGRLGHLEQSAREAILACELPRDNRLKPNLAEIIFVGLSISGHRDNMQRSLVAIVRTQFAYVTDQNGVLLPPDDFEGEKQADFATADRISNSSPRVIAVAQVVLPVLKSSSLHFLFSDATISRRTHCQAMCDGNRQDARPNLHSRCCAFRDVVHHRHASRRRSLLVNNGDEAEQ